MRPLRGCLAKLLPRVQTVDTVSFDMGQGQQGEASAGSDVEG
jgi:hypothetical protein